MQGTSQKLASEVTLDLDYWLYIHVFTVYEKKSHQPIHLMDEIDPPFIGNHDEAEWTSTDSIVVSNLPQNGKSKTLIKVLLVEDEEDSYRLIKMLLTNNQRGSDTFQLDWASDYDQAKQLLAQNKYHAYLIDYYLGTRNGVELMQEALAGGCRGPIILLTSGAGSEVEKNAIKMGAADYIVKGQITPDYLQRSIRYTIDRRSLEYELAELREREQSPNGLVIVDQQGTVQYVNKSAEVFLAVEAGNQLDKTFSYPYSNVQTYEIEILDEQEQSGTGEISAVDITYHNEPAQLISIVNITEHKKLRDQLNATNNLLEKSNRSLEQFAHIASHDFQSPLANLKILLELFRKDTNDPDHNLKVIEGIKMGAGQLERSFSGLLDILKVHYGYREANQRIDIPQIYLEVEKMIQEIITESKVVISTNFKEMEMVYNSAHFKSILLNLLSNAVKFRAADRPPVISLTTEKVGGKVQLTVKDNGLGIDLEKHGDDLFGSFKRFHREVDGIGIGLHNIKSIIESHGGLIEVQSQPNVGTIFTIKF